MIATLAVLSVASATPRFAIRSGAACDLCHVNPTGAGMRNAYGRDVYARMELPLKLPAKPGLVPGYYPDSEHSVAVGGDLRAAFLAFDSDFVVDPATQEPFKLPELLSFMLMQADVYGAASVHEHVALYLDYGVASTSFEAFGLVHSGPAGSWVKAGAFVPPYGMRIPNHRVFVREEGLGLDPNLREAGVEVGAAPGPVTLTLAAFNGGGGAAGMNPDLKLGFSGIADVLLVAKPVHVRLGVSGWHEPGGRIDPVTEEDTTRLDQRAGVYAAASAGPVAVLAEWDQRRSEDPANGIDQRLVAAYHELSVQVRKGLELQALHELMDPDTRLTPNAITRVGGGFELYPAAHTELSLLYRHGLAPAAAELHPDTVFSAAMSSSDEITAMLHLYL